jgi:uncharacterized protein
MLMRENRENGSQISQLGLGCMRFPKNGLSIDQNKVNQMVSTAIESGVNYFDTAYIYPGSEQALGIALQACGKRDKVNIATKLPLFLCKSYADFDNILGKQLERLKTDYIDYYLLHMIQELGAWERLEKLGIKEWISQKIDEGKIRNIGFSFHGGRHEFIKIIDAYDWQFCMVQYNYLDENNQASHLGVRYAHEKGLPVFVMEPLRGGMLVNGLPKEAVQIFEKENNNYSLVDWALRWLFNQPEITMVLSGMSNQEQLDDNIRIASEANIGDITDLSVYERVVSAINAKVKVPCTACSYCMPCPHGVDIPTCFSSYNESYVHKFGTGFKSYFMATGSLSTKQSYASKCKKCGVCEKHCPQHIKISSELSNVSKRLEPLLFKIGIVIARKVMIKK